jgi:transcription termination factor Rho
VVEGSVELQPNGSGFVRIKAGETSDDDVYVSAAQVKRCELVTGDTVAGPVRAPRRSERYPSMIRVDTINGKPADEVSEGTRFDDLKAAFPTERLELGGDDVTLNAVEWLAPFGRGSRVVVAGGPLAGKSDLLRRIAGALAGREGLELSVVLAGVRPEELGEWGEGIAPAATSPLGTSGENQAQTVEQVVEQGRRVAARGGHAVVIIDSLDQVPAPTARRALAAARNLVDGGSLTVIASATTPLGGETTVIMLDAMLTSLRRFPAIFLPGTATMRPELLVGDAGADKIAQARSEALAGK